MVKVTELISNGFCWYGRND